MGSTEGCTLLVELSEGGPKRLVAIPGYSGTTSGDELEGKIENISKSSGFDVRYKGKIDGKAVNTLRHYVKEEDRFVRQGPAVLEHCGEEE
jgi:hypothetical protein